MFGGKLLATDTEQSRLKDFLQIHLDIQRDIRQLLEEGLGGIWINSEDPRAVDIQTRIVALSKQSSQCIIGACSVDYDPRR
jgi:hypothetical protein